MKEEWKVYIKGVPDSDGKVIKVLADLGGKNNFYNGQYDDFIYFINHNGDIECEQSDLEIAKIIMDNYTDFTKVCAQLARNGTLRKSNLSTGSGNQNQMKIITL